MDLNLRPLVPETSVRSISCWFARYLATPERTQMDLIRQLSCRGRGAGCPTPPHRSARAGFLHAAPTADTWRRSASGIRYGCRYNQMVISRIELLVHLFFLS